MPRQRADGNSVDENMCADCPEEKKEKIDASDILATIIRGKRVEHDCVIITGDLVLQASELIKVQIGPSELPAVTAPIILTNSVIQGKVTFKDILFCEAVDFRGTSFVDKVSFIGSIFRQQCVFEDAHFYEATYFSGNDPRIDKHARFIGQSNFKKTIFEKYVDFNNVEFRRCAEFGSQNRQESFNNKSIFKGRTIFKGAKFNGIAHFEACEFQDTGFRGARFEKEAYFQNATFKGYTNFLETFYKAYTDFNAATFSGKGVSFAEAIFFGYFTDFRKVLFDGIHGNFRATQFTGEFVSFRNAKFRNKSDQELACRKAKNVLSKGGNRDDEEYHFYKEMEAIRIQKGIRGNSGLGLGDCLKTDTWSFWKFFLYDVIEWFFVQKIFGYGVHPYWLFAWWLAFVVVFAVVYSIKGGIEESEAKQWYDFFWFSIATAATPGYALYKPISYFKFIAGVEAILGTFMWAAFITTFARKFSR